MIDEKLQNIISELEKLNNRGEAYFGFYQYGGDIDESCIRANKQGLYFFSIELLKAGLELKNIEFINGEKEHFEIDISWTDSNADFYFDSIELTKKIKIGEEPFPEYIESWKDKAYGFLILVIILLLIVLTFIGFFTVVSWIFE